MMMYTDSSRGRNIAKDPAVIKFKGKYFMYYSMMPVVGKPDSGWGIGIATSNDLESWDKIRSGSGWGGRRDRNMCTGSFGL